jgi:serine/threonine protein kinase
MELAKIDLHKWISISPSLSRRCLIVRQVIEAVYLLHQIGIVHGDLKTANLVLVDDITGNTGNNDNTGNTGNKVKIIDFGFSGPPKWAFTQYTTPIYKDPYETGEPGSIGSFSADIYALGIIMIELFTGFEFESPPTSHKIREITHSISRDYRYLIRSMTSAPKKRPNISQVMEHFGIDGPVLPSLKRVSIRQGEISIYEKRYINSLITICNISGPNKVSDFFILLSIFCGMADYRTDIQFYILAIIYIYSAYFHNPVNYPALLSMAPSYYNRKIRKIKLAKKIDFLINNEQFIIKLLSMIN